MSYSVIDGLVLESTQFDNAGQTGDRATGEGNDFYHAISRVHIADFTFARCPSVRLSVHHISPSVRLHSIETKHMVLVHVTCVFKCPINTKSKLQLSTVGNF